MASLPRDTALRRALRTENIVIDPPGQLRRDGLRIAMEERRVGVEVRMEMEGRRSTMRGVIDHHGHRRGGDPDPDHDRGTLADLNLGRGLVLDGAHDRDPTQHRLLALAQDLNCARALKLLQTEHEPTLFLPDRLSRPHLENP